jgi:hypothetical protein
MVCEAWLPPQGLLERWSWTGSRLLFSVLKNANLCFKRKPLPTTPARQEEPARRLTARRSKALVAAYADRCDASMKLTALRQHYHWKHRVNGSIGRRPPLNRSSSVISGP